MRERERVRVRRYLALLLAFTMIFTSSSMNVLAATIIGGYKNRDKGQTTVGESETTVETEIQGTEIQETEAPETGEDGTEIRKNVVIIFLQRYCAFERSCVKIKL